MAQGPAKLILLIEDDDATGEFLKILFTRDGFDIAIVDNATSALKYLEAGALKKVSLVIADLATSRMDGIEFVRELQQPGYQNVPVCVLTSKELDMGTVKMIKMESNVCHLMRKPIDPGEMRESIFRLLKISPE